jgi:hypothetical protein
MLQQRQIVVKALGKQIDIEDPAYRKHAGTSFHSITWMFISVIVTIYRTIALQSDQSSSSCRVIMTTKLLRSCI